LTSGTSGRLDELESRLAFQDDLLEHLNEVVARQDQELANLQRKLTELTARLKDFEQSHPAIDTPSHEEPPPPHY